MGAHRTVERKIPLHPPILPDYSFGQWQLKTDLDLRPIYHKTDDASMAHLHLGLVAYFLVSTIHYQLKLQGINHNWSEIVRIINTQKMVTTTIENNKNQTIQIRQCSKPTDDVRQIYIQLKYHQIPLPQKNPCGTLAKFLKMKNQIASLLWMDKCNVDWKKMWVHSSCRQAGEGALFHNLCTVIPPSTITTCPVE